MPSKSNRPAPIEKLRIAAYVAPRVRGDSPRRIKIVDRDGNVVRETTSAELTESLCAKADIEFDVGDSVKPLKADCRICGRPFLLPQQGHKPVCCPSHRAEALQQTVCAGFDGPCPEQCKPSLEAFDPYRVKMRGGEPWRCRVCAGRLNAARVPSNRWSEAGRAAWATKTPEQRSVVAGKIHAAQTPEQRAERQRKAAETLKKRRAAGIPSPRRKDVR
jgi:hypothetical protein